MTATKPSKQAVRDYMRSRSTEVTPPPTPEQIRRELGWGLIEDERAAAQKGST